MKNASRLPLIGCKRFLFVSKKSLNESLLRVKCNVLELCYSATFPAYIIFFVILFCAVEYIRGFISVAG